MRAVVDIGSNSIKFVLAKHQRDVPKIHKQGSWISRLGKGLEVEPSKRESGVEPSAGVLAEDSLAKTKQALEDIRKILQAEMGNQYGPRRVKVVATAAVRSSKNPEVVHKLVEEILEVPLQVLTGQEEARYSFLGASAAAGQMCHRKDFAYFEVGGASTQIGVLLPTFKAYSFNAGAVSCHEGLGLNKMPVSPDAWEKAKAAMPQYFSTQVLAGFQSAFAHQFGGAMAIGGSLVLAAKLAGFSTQGSYGYSGTRKQLEALNEKLFRMGLSERLNLRGMEEGRADIRCAGILCVTHLLSFFNIEKIGITRWGLRHGIIRDWP